MASTEPFAELLARASFHFTKARPLMPMYLHLILASLFPIYTGAQASLSRPSSAAKPKKAKKTQDSEDDEEEETVQKMEGLSNTDAIILPVTAALTLGILYFLIMKYGAEIINLIMGYYFSGVGVFSVTKLANDATNVLVSFLFPTYYAHKGALWKVDSIKHRAIRQDASADTMSIPNPTPPDVAELSKTQSTDQALWSLRRQLKQKYVFKAYIHTVADICMNVTIINILSALLGVGTIVYVSTVSKPWFLTNLQGFAVSYSALQLLSPTSFTTGSLILGALFCYDIWAVFFTPLMVGVAKNLDQPIKLVFPRPDEPSMTPGEPPVKSFSMLGLGDIVVPGIMLGLALRFDLYMFYLKKQKKGSKISIDSSTGEATTEVVVDKATYVSPTGRWGDSFWTLSLPKSVLPPQLKSYFPKPYFTASMTGYVAGMIVTLVVMSVFQHAQPALLYLVPSVLISLWSTALVRGELKEMWEFSEGLNAEQAGVEGDEKEKDEAKAGKDDKESAKGLFERLWQEIWPAKEDKKDDKSKKVADSAEDDPKTKAKKHPAEDPKASPNKDTLVSFSFSRFNPKGSVATKIEKAEPKPESEASESSEDAVLVSATDLESSVDSDLTPRLRNRSDKTHNG